MRILGAAAFITGCTDNPPTEPTPPAAELPQRGAISVTVSTAGVDIDPDGYLTWVDGQPAQAVAVNGEVRIAGLAIGSHLVRLDGLALNCQVDGTNERSVDVTFAGQVSVSFSVSCVRIRQLAFVNAADGNIYVINSDGTGTSRITATGGALNPAWSPDGSRIAFASNRASNRDGGDFEIHVMNANGTGEVRLTNAVRGDHSPAWSPDGASIAFVSERDFNAEIYAMSADGTNPVRLTSRLSNDSDPAWSPDGSRIAFTSNRDGNKKIYLMNPDGSGVTRLTSNNLSDSQPSWSPDGSRIVFSRETGSDRYAIFTMKADGSDPARLTEDFARAADPVWSRDGQIAFTTLSSCTSIPFYQYDCVGEILILRTDRTVYYLNKGSTFDPAWQP